MIRSLLATTFAIVLLAGVVDAQWLHYVASDVPRTADGTPDLSAPTPHTADGKPDLSGVWMHEQTSVADMRRLFGADRIDEAVRTSIPGMEIGTQNKYAFDILLDAGEGMLRPEAKAVMQRRLAQRDPSRVCSSTPGAGLPLADLLSEPIKIVQAPRMTLVLTEVGMLYRQIYADGRSFPDLVNLPAYLGYSIGRWDGDTFVVDTRGFNDKTVLDSMGHPHSDELRVTERFHRRDFGHMDVEMTFDDPRMYTRPFTINVPHGLLADGDIFEMFCENEKDGAHIVISGGAGAEQRPQQVKARSGKRKFGR